MTTRGRCIHTNHQVRRSKILATSDTPRLRIEDVRIGSAVCDSESPDQKKIIDTVTFFQDKKNRIRDCSRRIERAVAVEVPVFPRGHPCNTKEGKVLVRVSAPHDKEGNLKLKTPPGQQLLRYHLSPTHQIAQLTITTDFREIKPSQIFHLIVHMAGRGIGYKARENKIVDRPDWFTRHESSKSVPEGSIQWTGRECGARSGGKTCPCVLSITD